MPKDSACHEWSELRTQAGINSGRRIDIAGEVGGWMEKVGFVNVHQRKIKLPYGPWPKVTIPFCVGEVLLMADRTKP